MRSYLEIKFAPNLRNEPLSISSPNALWIGGKFVRVQRRKNLSFCTLRHIQRDSESPLTSWRLRVRRRRCRRHRRRETDCRRRRSEYLAASQRTRLSGEGATNRGRGRWDDISVLLAGITMMEYRFWVTIRWRFATSYYWLTGQKSFTSAVSVWAYAVEEGWPCAPAPRLKLGERLSSISAGSLFF